jgi:hypothetical protein
MRRARHRLSSLVLVLASTGTWLNAYLKEHRLLME